MSVVVIMLNTSPTLCPQPGSSRRKRVLHCLHGGARARLRLPAQHRMCQHGVPWWGIAQWGEQSLGSGSAGVELGQALQDGCKQHRRLLHWLAVEKTTLHEMTLPHKMITHGLMYVSLEQALEGATPTATDNMCPSYIVRRRNVLQRPLRCRRPHIQRMLRAAQHTGHIQRHALQQPGLLDSSALLAHTAWDAQVCQRAHHRGKQAGHTQCQHGSLCA